ncbi:transposase [Candidatus Contendibacter odensensis]|uniref:Transposase IS4-like domain-containing protein n=1 Tax=Candidatus Contendobacter odensis Run_B_J11 TaxID=1400861 RepID=A0A7U7J535_9GAMM|nr:transposase [Candidatus Contendobacter odensis]CDH45945.1 hypothetical protein BN874_3020002 [Candidatus Contendobacter odensis Run_B_J11]
MRLLRVLLAVFRARWETRQRPLPPAIEWARTRYTQLLAADGSTLDALLRKVGLLQQDATHPLAGRMTALLELTSRLPWQLWYEPDPQTHDQRCWPQILAVLRAGMLLIVDLGYTNFSVFAQLTQAQVTFITRAKSNLVYQVETTLQRNSTVHDGLVWIGQGVGPLPRRVVSLLDQRT